MLAQYLYVADMFVAFLKTSKSTINGKLAMSGSSDLYFTSCLKNKYRVSEDGDGTVY